MSRKNPPAKIVLGSTLVLDGPTIILIVCGTMSPTKPIIPEKATEKATIRADTVSVLTFNLFTSTPNEWASSSPDNRASNSCLLE